MVFVVSIHGLHNPLGDIGRTWNKQVVPSGRWEVLGHFADLRNNKASTSRLISNSLFGRIQSYLYYLLSPSRLLHFSHRSARFQQQQFQISAAEMDRTGSSVIRNLRNGAHAVGKLPPRIDKIGRLPCGCVPCKFERIRLPRGNPHSTLHAEVSALRSRARSGRRMLMRRNEGAAEAEGNKSLTPGEETSPQ